MSWPEHTLEQAEYILGRILLKQDFNSLVEVGANAMSNPLDANTQFNQLWEEVGKHRLIVGDEDDKHISIRCDLDLSPISLLKRMQVLSEEGESKGVLGSGAKKSLHDAIDDWEKALSKGGSGKLKQHWKSLLTRGAIDSNQN